MGDLPALILLGHHVLAHAACVRKRICHAGRKERNVSGKARRFEIAYLSVFVAYMKINHNLGAETANHLARK